MQSTRKEILEILKERGDATVDDIVQDLTERRGSITAVTVRHHLAKLQDEGLVDSSQMLHRASPGRPQHIYVLTTQGISFFPNNYQHIAANLLKQVQQLPDDQVNVILEGMVDSMASEISFASENMRERLNTVIKYLNEHGYEADWEVADGGYLLNASNCPYHEIARDNDILCKMDMRLIAKMLGVVPRMTSHMSSGGETCSYFIPYKP